MNDARGSHKEQQILLVGTMKKSHLRPVACIHDVSDGRSWVDEPLVGMCALESTGPAYSIIILLLAWIGFDNAENVGCIEL